MIRVLIAGPSCSISEKARDRVDRVVNSRGVDCQVGRVTDSDAILALGVYAIPGLIVDGVLKSVGRVPEEAELIHWLDSDPG